MDTLRMMEVGARTLASYGREHTAKHAAAGLSAAEWRLLTQEELWTAADRRKVRPILAECVNVSLTLAGLPAGPLPAEYVAAVIVQLVHPCNRLVAAERAPEAFLAVQASGLQGQVEIEPVARETMISLVTAYTAGPAFGLNMRPLYGEPADDAEAAERAAAA